MFPNPDRDRIRLIVNADNSVERSGHVTPRGTRIHWRGKTRLGGLLPEPVEVIALAVPSHKYWTSRGGDWSTAEATIEVYAVLGPTKDGEDVWCREILTLPARAATKLSDLA